jgi:hypothetical protein
VKKCHPVCKKNYNQEEVTRLHKVFVLFCYFNEYDELRVRTVEEIPKCRQSCLYSIDQQMLPQKPCGNWQQLLGISFQTVQEVGSV